MKSLPHSIEHEQSVISGLLNNPETAETVFQILTPDDFYNTAHKETIRAMQSLYNKGMPPDIVSTVQALREAGKSEKAGGAAHLKRLEIEHPVPSDTESYCRKIAELSTQRKVIIAANEITKRAGNGSGDDLGAFARQTIEKALESSRPAATGCTWECLADLQYKVFPEPRMVVPPILAEGSTILGAPPKIGKSVLAGNLCISVSTGGKALGAFDVEPGTVFYISLDDKSERRLKTRIERMLPAYDTAWPANFFYATDFPRADEGGIETLRQFIRQHPDTRLVVIDTMYKFLSGKRDRQKNAYEIDVDRLTPVAEMATEAGICLLLIHHTTKTKYADPFDSISGSIGTQGSVDDLIVIERERTGFKLSTRGRSLDDRSIILERHRQTFTWQYKGEAGEVMASNNQQAILDALKDDGGSMSPNELAKATGINRKTIMYNLKQFCEQGIVKAVGYGQYISMTT